MDEAKCSCAKFERIEGAGVAPYAAAFLDDLGRAGEPRNNLYRCRECGRLWERRAPDAAEHRARASLVRLPPEA
jgi:hypothetical protein